LLLNRKEEEVKCEDHNKNAKLVAIDQNCRNYERILIYCTHAFGYSESCKINFIGAWRGSCYW